MTDLFFEFFYLVSLSEAFSSMLKRGEGKVFSESFHHIQFQTELSYHIKYLALNNARVVRFTIYLRVKFFMKVNNKFCRLRVILSFKSFQTTHRALI